MALRRTHLGKHPTTGEPWFQYDSDDPAKAVLITGPAIGDMTVGDGTSYNVSEGASEVDPAHVDELCHLIGLQHEETGRFDVSAEESPTGEPIKWEHTDCAVCSSGSKSSKRRSGE